MQSTSKIIHGEALEALREMPDASVDAVVTDPPYGLKFMARAWDHSCPPSAIWRECLRVLKPGAYLLAFSGSRTVDLVMGKIREAGFEIRDCLMWLYGSGFPKSHDVSKALDKMAGIEREVIGKSPNWRPAKTKGGGGFDSFVGKGSTEINLTNPVSPIAQQWHGWGTALKPAVEPITMARKRLDKKTVAANMLEYGTGGINVDGCRIETNEKVQLAAGAGFFGVGREDNYQKGTGRKYGNKGRWPANVLLDEKAAAMLDEQSGERITGAGQKHCSGRPASRCKGADKPFVSLGYPDTGGASRFFYCAKASRSEREAGLEGKSTSWRCSCGALLKGHDSSKCLPRLGNTHNTVKPISLMRWLCRLVTPPGGLIVDPFAGSGTTVIAAGLEGFRCIGIEKEGEYVRIARARIAHWQGSDLPLFNERTP